LGRGWQGVSFLFIFDPVAADAYANALREFQTVVTLNGPLPKAVKAQATPWITNAADRGVGDERPGQIPGK